MRIKKILIISLGSIGKRHIRVIKKLRPEIKINLLRRKIPLNKSKEEELIYKTFHSDTFNTFKRYLQKFVNITMDYYSSDFIFNDFLKESEYDFYEKSVEYVELSLLR